MADTTAAEADAVLTYLKLNLLSLLPGKENIVRDHEVEGLHPHVLFPLYGLDEDSYLDLAKFIVERITAHQYGGTGPQVHFCITQLADVAPVQWILLTAKLNLTNRQIYNELDNLKLQAERRLENYGHKEAALTSFHPLWRLLIQLAAGEEPTKAWWDLDYLPPTKGDVDDYMRHLRKMVNLQPNI